MKIVDTTVLSTDGVHKLSGRVYVPEGEAVGYLQIVHGMAEHIERYDSFMQTMAENGYICFGYDHLGHGHTAEKSELGFIASSDGWKHLCLDVERFASAVRSEYGNMPYYLMGHSMGSFIVRLAVTMGSRPSKLIVMGTGGPNPAAGAGIFLCNLISALFGEKHISGAINGIAFGAYNKRFPGEGSKAWLTTVADQRDKYVADPLSGFDFTVSAMKDLMILNRDSNSAETTEKTPKDMPMLLVSGEDDPVGEYGRGVEAACERYKAAGCRAEMKLYKGARHEILNDFCREEAVSDIQKFLSL